MIKRDKRKNVAQTELCVVGTICLAVLPIGVVTVSAWSRSFTLAVHSLMAGRNELALENRAALHPHRARLIRESHAEPVKRVRAGLDCELRAGFDDQACRGSYLLGALLLAGCRAGWRARQEALENLGFVTRQPIGLRRLSI